jgi:hypothetical protein
VHSAQILEGFEDSVVFGLVVGGDTQKKSLLMKETVMLVVNDKGGGGGTGIAAGTAVTKNI